MKKEKNKFNYKSFVPPLIISIGLSVFISIFSFFINDTAFYKSFENIFQRAFFVEQNKKNDGAGIYYSSPYISSFSIIEIDEKTFLDLKCEWPMPRSYYGKLLKKLRAADARLICFDIFFPEKSKLPEDTAFSEQIKITPNLLLAYHLDVLNYDKLKPANQQNAEIIYPYELLYKSLGKDKTERFKKLGFVTTDTEIDGLIRTVPLIRPYNNETLTSFDTKILMSLLNASSNDVKPPSSPNDPLVIKNKKIPLNKDYSISLNFGITPENINKVLEKTSMSDVLNSPDSDMGYFKNKIVMIGVSATAGHDIKYFPVGVMPGMYGHLNTALTVLDNKFIKILPPFQQMLWILLFGALVGFFAAWLKPRYTIIVLLILFSISIFVSYKIFISQCIFMPMFPTLANIVLVFVSVNLYKYQQEQQAKKRLSVMIREFAPLPPDYLEKVIAEKTGAAQFGGKKEKLTILFSDIRGYTNLSEKLDPVDVMNTLNEYHGAMGEIFEKNGGVIFDYQGDAQMVVFGLIDPSREEHAFYAVKSGIEMQERVKKLVEKWGKKHEFEIGVGVCTGDVSLGIVGSAQRKQYAAIGDSTNVSARLQGMSKQLESPVLISDTAYEMCKDKIIADKLEPVSLKGKSEPLQVYRAKGIK